MIQSSSLKRSILVFINLLVISICLFSFLPSYYQQKTYLQNEFLAHGKSLAKNLANNCRDPLKKQDRATLYRLVNSLMKEPNIRWAAIQNAEGVIIAQNGADGIVLGQGKVVKYADKDILRIRQEETIFDIQVGVEDKLDFYQTAESSPDGYLGIIHVGLSLKKLYATNRKIFFQFMIIFFLVLLISSPRGVYFSNSFIKPLNRLVEMMQDIASRKGDLTQQIILHRNDELGMLAHNFNVFIFNIRQIVKRTIFLVNQMNISWKTFPPPQKN